MKTVTISVLTYNSSRFVLETLESIKAQTYSNLILHICDDCSTDNTVELCRDWIEKNKGRFESTDIIIPEHNTGVSANCNRAWDVCTTEYQKEIAADDILLPNCIADNMSYVAEHPDAVFVFSRVIPFGCDEERCRNFDHGELIRKFFALSPKEQHDYLYTHSCCIPAPACFVNVESIRKIGLRNDERIPHMEDKPKWLNALGMGVRFHFFDQPTVRYRIYEGSLSTASLLSPRIVESFKLFWFYYHFIPEYKQNPDKAIRHAVDEQMKTYQLYYDEVRSVRMSRRFSFLLKILRPFDKVRSFLMVH